MPPGQKWQTGPEITETNGRIKYQGIVGRVQVRGVSTSLVEGHKEGTKGRGYRRGIKGERKAVCHQGHVSQIVKEDGPHVKALLTGPSAGLTCERQKETEAPGSLARERWFRLMTLKLSQMAPEEVHPAFFAQQFYNYLYNQ